MRAPLIINPGLEADETAGFASSRGCIRPSCPGKRLLCGAAGEDSSCPPLHMFAVIAYESFRKLGVPYFGVLIIRNLLSRVLYIRVSFSETPR